MDLDKFHEDAEENEESDESQSEDSDGHEEGSESGEEVESGDDDEETEDEEQHRTSTTRYFTIRASVYIDTASSGLGRVGCGYLVVTTCKNLQTTASSGIL